MPPQLPEHVVITLLRQCYITPRCQASRLCPQPLPDSCTRHVSTFRPCTRLRHRHAARGGTQAGNSSIHTRAGDELQSSPKTSLLELAPACVGIHQSTVAFAAQHNDRGRKVEPARIAVLGGGITGLATAHYFARENPNAKITVYENSARLGGWLKSHYMDVDGESVLFESGPRTLRPGTPPGLVTLELIQELGLQNELLITSTASEAHQNRYLYYPDRLVKMPGAGQDPFDMAWRVMTEPVFKGLIWGALTEQSRPIRPSDMDDESVGSFLARRMMSDEPGNNIVSAVLHGIYAGDINQLSVKSLMPMMWHYEAWKGSIIKAVYTRMAEKVELVSKRDLELKLEVLPMIKADLLDVMRHASVYSFKEGIGVLSAALERALKENPNVEFKMETGVTAVEHDGESDSIKISTRHEAPAKYTKAISTVPSSVLSSLTSNTLPSLARTHSVTVMVVNLYFKDPHILTERGFGYLIPRSIPFTQNPERALGVVFDSDAVKGQDTATGTKVTVMLGGHWWDAFETYPDEEEGINMARSVLHRHLKITDKPAATRVSLQRNCIPQYTVGHESRLQAAHLDLMREFKGKLAVAGNSYTGVGLNDCVRAARDVVMGMKRGTTVTGLEDAGRKDLYAQVAVPSSADVEAGIRRREGRS
ncbi:oxygen-dependent protoporphyrinogen oxidase [Cadophora gregata]|uniref:oxygen-dependent protoporphyrinogen oxidase n=1 Tax=Cadophora gregata TaxID=51156 RepID=UPI0026DC17DE|nr:oxygen-dependent protoporphyrinogen oxidase [Cadophora gregata]KAK0102541.1 oxygen-dependent protoporphyrinogen oxidase [Cadophora gregata]KAK0104167.1 oxygen-dependent protoporphyrinogen oxidase [Cadophora gregata f. sp. sojae]